MLNNRIYKSNKHAKAENGSAYIDFSVAFMRIEDLVQEASI